MKFDTGSGIGLFKDVDGVLAVYSFQDTLCIDFVPPSSYYTRDALDQVVFFKGTSRKKCQSVCDSIYGEGKYKIASSKFF